MMNDETRRKAEEKLTRYLKQHGLRKTPERFAILARVLGLKGHFDAEKLHLTLDSSGYHVSLSTVYNALELLCECGLLRRHTFGREAQYEIEVGNHFHLICETCGKIKEVDDAELMRGIMGRRFSAFSPAYCSVSVYGKCNACIRKQRAAEAKKKKTSTTTTNRDK